MDTLEHQVAEFVAEFTRTRQRLTPSTTPLGDLGVDGNDGYELLTDFAAEFGVNMTDCDIDLHFGPEGLPPWFLLYWLVLALRRGTPEERARLLPITIGDLVESARIGRWWCGASQRLQ